MRARVFLGFLTALAPFLAAGSAAAQPAQPLDRLLPQIRRSVPGQFLDAEGATTGNNPHYHLKWLTPDGRVMYLDADARTGRVMGQSPGRDGFDAPRPRPPDGEPSDRGTEGRGNTERYDRQYNSRFDNFRQYDDRNNYPRPERNFGQGSNDRAQGGNDRGPGGGDRTQGNFGGRFDRGPGNDRGFGGRPDFGNRGGGNNGGDRGRRGDGR